MKTPLTIGRTDVTVAQLMEMQQVGRRLSDSFKNVSAGLYVGVTPKVHYEKNDV